MQIIDIAISSIFAAAAIGFAAWRARRGQTRAPTKFSSKVWEALGRSTQDSSKPSNVIAIVLPQCLIHGARQACEEERLIVQALKMAHERVYVVLSPVANSGAVADRRAITQANLCIRELDLEESLFDAYLQVGKPGVKATIHGQGSMGRVVWTNSVAELLDSCDRLWVLKIGNDLALQSKLLAGISPCLQRRRSAYYPRSWATFKVLDRKEAYQLGACDNRGYEVSVYREAASVTVYRRGRCSQQAQSAAPTPSDYCCQWDEEAVQACLHKLEAAPGKRVAESTEALLFDDLAAPAVATRAGRPVPQYSDVVIGGSFDRLHAGHRRLLKTVASLRPRRVVVGITGDAMLQRAGKPGHDLVQDFGTRRNALVEAASECMPASVETVEVHALDDPFGPSTRDPALNAIVASTETESGALAVNSKRQAAGLPRLAVILISRKRAAVVSSRFLRTLDQSS